MKDKNLKITISVIIILLLINNLYYLITNIIQIGFNIFNLQMLLSYIPMCIGIAGVIVFISSEFKKSSLLRIYMCYGICYIPFTCWYYYNMFFASQEMGSSRFGPLTYQTYIYFVVFLVHTITCIVGLQLLVKERIVKFKYINISGDSIIEFSPTSTGLRFANRFIDLLMIIFIVYHFVTYYTGGYTSYGERDQFNDPTLLTVLEIVALLFYYLIMEVIFNTTAGKCATNTIIVDNEAKATNIGQRIGRTFCRLIPFEALSFFSGTARGWHDSITDTYVVDSIHLSEKTNKIS